MSNEIRICVSYRLPETGKFPLNEDLDKKIREAMATIGAKSYGSGTGCGERDLVFKLSEEELGR